MTFYKNKEKFERGSIKVGIVFSRLRLSPNQWTLSSLIPALIAFYLLTSSRFLLAGIFFFISAFIDLIDGSVARVTGHVTKLGGYLDTMMDRYVEFLIIFALLFCPLPDFAIPVYCWTFIFLFGSMMTSYAKAAAGDKLGKDVRGGIVERAERIALLCIGILLAHFDRVYLTYMVVILAILTNISALQRLAVAVRKDGSAGI
ncbi:MAG: CDP-alcohol phosphatidyltransferase family protein [Methanocellales archaeon]|nr:CDP-alcohol phosphatidyltransferase family protein [Methanocellales archaeon]